MPTPPADSGAAPAASTALHRLRSRLLDADEDLLAQHVLLGDRDDEDAVLAWLDGFVDAARALAESARELDLALAAAPRRDHYAPPETSERRSNREAVDHVE